MGKRTVAMAVLAVLIVGGVGLVWWRSEQAKDDGARLAFETLAGAVPEGVLATGTDLTFAEPGAAEASDRIAQSLSGHIGAGTVGVVERDGDHASAALHINWTAAGEARDTLVPVSATLDGDTWVIDPPAQGTYLSTRIEPDETVSVTTTWADRGDILDRDGTSLMPVGEVFPVQIDPARASVETVRALEGVVDEPAGSLVKKLKAAHESGSKAPIPVITYRKDDFLDRRVALDELIGVIYPRTEQPLARTRTYGQPLLGSFGDVTAEVIENSDGRYAAGDRAGLSGLQDRYDTVLGGTPGVVVETSGGTVLFEREPVPGEDVELTLDAEVQEAAEDAIRQTGDVPSVLVAVDVPSGDLIAVANHPALSWNRALAGKYPPGSTFKVATTYALLSGGHVTPSTPVPCPATTVVNGMTVRNFEGGELASPTFADDFHNSCNTAFVGLASKLAPDDLASAAQALGLTGDWAEALGVSGAFSAEVPVTNGETDHAAAAIGQGRNLVSPAALAVMAGNVARGSVVAPALVTSPEPAGLDRTPRPLDDEVVAQLHELMRGVVTDGSGQALAELPGAPVHGKSGTAEFGTKDPPETRAWFIGWQGDVAFAVLVEKGRSGGTVAAPIVKDFLESLADS